MACPWPRLRLKSLALALTSVIRSLVLALRLKWLVLALTAGIGVMRAG